MRPRKGFHSATINYKEFVCCRIKTTQRVEYLIKVSDDQKRRVARLPSKTTPKVVALGRENDTAPLVLADTGVADGAASATKLFNDDCMSAHREHRGEREIQITRTYAGSSAGSVTCWTGSSAGSVTCWAGSSKGSVTCGAGSRAGSVICTGGSSAGSVTCTGGSSKGSVT